MDEKYLKFSAADFAQDLKFINWVKKGTDKKEWDDFIRENPNLSDEIKIAKEIVLALGFSAKVVGQEDIYHVYKNIEKFYLLHTKRKHTGIIRRLMKYAAIFIVVFSLGAIFPYYYYSRIDHRFTEIPVYTSGINDAKIILPDGEEVLLKEKQTDIEFNAAGNQIKIDQDSVIHFNQNVNKNAMAQVVIPFGQRSNILLSDGTRVWMNAGSKLIFPQKFSGKSRKVFLQGEAYFDVFKDKAVPFIVSTDKMDVIVHGTEFNLKNIESDDNLEVVLVEGAVSLKKNSVMSLIDGEIKLIPNQKATFNKAEDKTSVESNVNVGYYTSWREGLLEFNRESILNVFTRLSRFYNIHFVTENSVELNRKISGKLDLKASLEDVLKVISDAAPVTFRIDNDKVLVTSRINYLPMR